MQTKKTNNQGQTSLEMTITVVAIFVMIVETLVGTMGLPLFFK